METEVFLHYIVEAIKNWQVTLSVVAFFAAIVLEIKLMSEGKLFNSDRKRMERATKAGHVVDAYLIHTSSKIDDRGISVYSGDYEYYVNGKRYVKKGSAYHQGQPPQYRRYYYLDNPKHAFTEGSIHNPLEPLLAIIFPFAMAVVIKMLLDAIF